MRLMVHPGAVGEVFNIGNPEEVTILELAQRIKAATSSSSTIVKIPYDQAYEAGFEDMPRRVPDLTKIQAAVGYKPTVGLDEIIARVIEFQRSRLRLTATNV
jgi:UDP-glucose 4-epimerase